MFHKDGLIAVCLLENLDMKKEKIFQMVYFANGGFNWHDVYFMPVRLREFYYRELLKAKEEETSQMEKVSKSNSSSKTKRK